MTATINIEKKRGDTRRHSFKLSSDASVVDISGWTAFSMAIHSIKKPEDDTTLVEEIDGTLATDGTDGRVFFVPSGSIAVGKYFYDIQAIDSNSEKITFIEGEYSVLQDRNKR
jgi:hypothetical protein